VLIGCQELGMMMARCAVMLGMVLPLQAASGAFDVDFRMRVSDTAEFTKAKVGDALRDGIAAAVDGVEASMVAIASVGPVPTPAPTAAPTPATLAPTPASSGSSNETEATTAAPTAAPTPAPAAAPTPATLAPTPAATNETEATTAVPTPAPVSPRRLRSRRLAAGEMLVVASFTGVVNVTVADVEAASQMIEAKINEELNGTVTVSALSAALAVTAAPTPAPTGGPTPAPTQGDANTSAAVPLRLGLWIPLVALLAFCGRT